MDLKDDYETETMILESQNNTKHSNCAQLFFKLLYKTLEQHQTHLKAVFIFPNFMGSTVLFKLNSHENTSIKTA